MAELTLQQRFVRYLKAQGAVKVVSNSRKYEVYRGKVDGEEVYYHLGKAGACRTSKDGVVKHSFDSRYTKQCMKLWEVEQGLD